MAPFRVDVYVLEFAGEDDEFAAAEARAAATAVEVVAPGLGITPSVDMERVRGLAFTHRVSEVLARTDGGLDDLVGLLESAALGRVGAGSEEATTVAVRARDVRGTAGIDTQAVERRLGQVLVDRGFRVDLSTPDYTIVALFAGERAIVGREVAASDRGYGDRAPTDRPFFQPGSMDPLLARAVVNLAAVRPGDRVLDPMCGTGGLLIEAGLLGGRPIGIDAQAKMVNGARQNLQSILQVPSLLVQGDGTALPIPDGGVDAVVFDVPYGRQSKIAGHGLEALVRGALAEARRVAPRAVVVADRSYDELAREAGWAVGSHHHRTVHRSLTRHIHVLK